MANVSENSSGWSTGTGSRFACRGVEPLVRSRMRGGYRVTRTLTLLPLRHEGEENAVADSTSDGSGVGKSGQALEQGAEAGEHGERQ